MEDCPAASWVAPGTRGCHGPVSRSWSPSPRLLGVSWAPLRLFWARMCHPCVHASCVLRLDRFVVPAFALLVVLPSGCWETQKVGCRGTEGSLISQGGAAWSGEGAFQQVVPICFGGHAGWLGELEKAWSAGLHMRILGHHTLEIMCTAAISSLDPLGHSEGEASPVVLW